MARARPVPSRQLGLRTQGRRLEDDRVQGRSRIRLVSRHGVDHTGRFAQLAAAIGRLPAQNLILDGEVCIFDSDLVSQFHLLADEGRRELATPPVFIAFDCLYRRGRDLRPRPLRDRRAALEDEIAGAGMVFPSLRLDGDGFVAWAEVKRRGWEGLLAKDEKSRYVGGRSRSWVKLKVRHEGRFAVVGLDTGEGRPSLLLAARDGRRLVYVGRVEWGVTHGAVDQIAERCTTRPAPRVRRRRAAPWCPLGRTSRHRRGDVQRADAWPTARSRPPHRPPLTFSWPDGRVSLVQRPVTETST